MRLEASKGRGCMYTERIGVPKMEIGVKTQRVLLVSGLTLALGAWPVSLFAQATTGAVAQISGTVSDPTGARIPTAQVKAIQTNTGYNRTVVTGAGGVYVLPNLPIGPYNLQVNGPGFQSYSQKGIVLEVNNN